MTTSTGKNVTQARRVAILNRFLKAQDRLVYQTSDLSLSSLASMTSSGSRGKSAIDLAPDFQRRKRWTQDKQSALIESFLLNVPVPPIYLAEDSYGQYSVVDGKQRLTAIHAFMTQGLRLKKLESFTELEGLSFSELPDDLQNALSIRPYVRVVTLLKQSDPSLKFEVFTRLNRGGEQMLAQELRKVAYRGDLSDEIYSLAEHPFLKSKLKITSDSSPAYIQMNDAEYVLRFLTLAGNWQTFSGSLRDELDRFMATNSKLDKKDATKLGATFTRALSGCEEIWGNCAFQRYSGTVWRDQFLAGMYDAEMISVHLLTDAELQNAIAHRRRAIAKTAELFEDAVFEKSVRQGTNTPSSVRHRINSVLAVLKSL